MSVLKSIIGTLSFNETDSKLGWAAQKLYFAGAYNTTFIVNAMLALGSVSPFLIYMAIRGQLTEGAYLGAVFITLISAHCYNLVYIVNDIIDRRKDEKLKIPKLTARHILGESYLFWLALVYALVFACLGLGWRSLLLPLAVYNLALICLSWLHSHAGKLKYLTVFVERWAKFCSPFGLLWLANGNVHTGLMLAGAMLSYPLGFTLDYAYRGYIRDRLKLPTTIRFITYFGYWVGVGLVLIFKPTENVAERIEDVAIYVAVYFGTVALSDFLAKVLPYGFLDNHYTPKVVWEKRRLLTYGMVQLLILAFGACYVAVR